jgi:hypothetical protein
MRDAIQPGSESGRILQLAQVLVSFYENVLRQILGVFPIFDEPQQVIEDPLFPPGHKEVIGLHVVAAGLCDQVAVLNLPKDQLSGSVRMTYSARKKTISHVRCGGM